MPLVPRPRLRPLLVVWMDAAQVAPHMTVENGGVKNETQSEHIVRLYEHVENLYDSSSALHRALSRVWFFLTTLSVLVAVNALLDVLRG